MRKPQWGLLVLHRAQRDLYKNDNNSNKHRGLILPAQPEKSRLVSPLLGYYNNDNDNDNL